MNTHRAIINARRQLERARKLNEQQASVLNNVSALLDIAESDAASERYASFGHPMPNDEVKPRVRKSVKPLTADDVVLDILRKAMSTYTK
jgi:hypothetical protein